MSTELGNPQLDILDILSNLGEKSLVDVNKHPLVAILPTADSVF